MEDKLFEQCAELFAKLGLEVNISTKHFVSGLLIIKTKPVRKLLAKGLQMSVSLKKYQGDKNKFNAQLRIDSLKTPIISSQTFENIQELEQLINNNLLLNNIISNKRL